MPAMMACYCFVNALSSDIVYISVKDCLCAPAQTDNQAPGTFPCITATGYAFANQPLIVPEKEAPVFYTPDNTWSVTEHAKKLHALCFYNHTQPQYGSKKIQYGVDNKKIATTAINSVQSGTILAFHYFNPCTLKITTGLFCNPGLI